MLEPFDLGKGKSDLSLKKFTGKIKLLGFCSFGIGVAVTHMTMNMLRPDISDKINVAREEGIQLGLAQNEWNVTDVDVAHEKGYSVGFTQGYMNGGNGVLREVNDAISGNIRVAEVLLKDQLRNPEGFGTNYHQGLSFGTNLLNDLSIKFSKDNYDVMEKYNSRFK